jgi:AcrR family transcriptional regulator
VVRLKRPEQSARNRERVLQSAFELFRERGFHGATLEAIADAAGFSKGVIYSQFGSKDDLFLALSESRGVRRLERLRKVVREAAPENALDAVWQASRAARRADVRWSLVVLEFRAHAARSPKLNRSYAAIRMRVVEVLAEVLEALAERSGEGSRHAPRDLARLMLVLDSGAVLENLVSAPGATFDLSRRAFQLLLKDATPRDGEAEAVS